MVGHARCDVGGDGEHLGVLAIARLRALQRQQANFVAQRTRTVQWMQNALDQMNVQVHRAVSDVTGLTGMAIIRAIVKGERDPLKLAALRHGRCLKSEAQIAKHLTGAWREEHLFNLAASLAVYDTLEKMIATYDERLLEELTAMWRMSGADLLRIDGISATAAQLLLTARECAALRSQRISNPRKRLCQLLVRSTGARLPRACIMPVVMCLPSPINAAILQKQPPDHSLSTAVTATDVQDCEADCANHAIGTPTPRCSNKFTASTLGGPQSTAGELLQHTS